MRQRRLSGLVMWKGSQMVCDHWSENELLLLSKQVDDICKVVFFFISCVCLFWLVITISGWYTNVFLFKQIIHMKFKNTDVLFKSAQVLFHMEPL